MYCVYEHTEAVRVPGWPNTTHPRRFPLPSLWQRTKATIQEGKKEMKVNLNRVTDEMIDLLVSDSEHIYQRIPNTTMTVCVLRLANGFCVQGVSACVDPDNFDQTVGEQIAFENAREKLWELEGYRLACDLTR